MRDIAKAPPKRIIKINSRFKNLFDVCSKNNINGNLNAMEAAVMFLFPANPFASITVKPSLAERDIKSLK